MIWSLISLIFRWLSIIRWNNFPRVENVSENDNLAMVLHTCFVLHKILAEKFDIQTDINFIYKKILFSSFITFVLSDINSELKKNMIQKNNLIYAKLELKVYNIILWLDIPQQIKKDIQGMMQADNTLFGDKFKIENDLITFAKIIVARQEARNNAVVYKDTYKTLIEEMDQRLKYSQFEIFNKCYTKNVQKYLSTIRRLQFCHRWNRTRRKYPVSVLSHLYIVFAFGYFIGILENLDLEKTIEIMTRGLFHDVSEALTGDVLTYTKNAVEWLRDLICDIEEEVIDDKLLINLKKFKFKYEIKNYILNPMEDDLWNLVKIADIFSALFEARIEAPQSSEYQQIYSNTKKILNKKNKKSVDYIHKFGIDYFDENFIDDFLGNEKAAR